MYASVVFREDITAGHAHYLLELGSRLTYEQLVLLQLVHSAR